jgi:hypothetical protein
MLPFAFSEKRLTFSDAKTPAIASNEAGKADKSETNNGWIPRLAPVSTWLTVLKIKKFP